VRTAERQPRADVARLHRLQPLDERCRDLFFARFCGTLRRPCFGEARLVRDAELLAFTAEARVRFSGARRDLGERCGAHRHERRPFPR
jgi:hypothetical protein